MKKLFGTMVSCLILSSSAMAWTKGNDPRNMDNRYRYKFDSLPTSGRISLPKMPWASSFWPNIYGGIAFRWNNYYQEKPSFEPLHMKINSLKSQIEELQHELFNSKVSETRKVQVTNEVIALKNEVRKTESIKGAHHKKYFFDMKRPKSLAEVKSMSREQLAKLSPAEKFDIYMADYSFPLTADVLNRANPYDAYWEGICHAWSTAAIEFHEPKAMSVRNKDGILVEFGSSDLKALLNYYHAAIRLNWRTRSFMQTPGVGLTCKTAYSQESWFIGQDGKEYYKVIQNGKTLVKPVPEECVDTNPGAFHVVAANQLGVMDEPFVAELVTDSEIWNQPVNGFKSKILADSYSPRRNATEGTFRQVTIETEVFYANDGGRMFWPQNDPKEEFYAWWDATNGTPNYRESSKTLKYHLDIDRNGNIIGGMWLSYDRPDFIWKKTNKLPATNGFVPVGWGRGIVNYMHPLKNLVKVRK